MDKTCRTCIWRPNGWQESRPEYCYKWDHHTAEDNSCEAWADTLRAAPVNDPPMITLFEGVNKHE